MIFQLFWKKERGPAESRIIQRHSSRSSTAPPLMVAMPRSAQPKGCGRQFVGIDHEELGGASPGFNALTGAIPAQNAENALSSGKESGKVAHINLS